MTNDRSARTLIAATLLLAAVFVAMNRAVVSAPLTDWWLPLVLAVAGIAVAIVRTPSRAQASTTELRPRIREYLPPPAPATPPAPTLPASPETAGLPPIVETPVVPEIADEEIMAVAVDESGGVLAAAVEETPPAPTAPEADAPMPAVGPVPASPQTPVGTVEAAPVEPVPVSPETPAVPFVPEPLPASPETAAVENVMPAHADTGEQEPAATVAAGVVNPTADQIPLPADQPSEKNEPSFMARNEYVKAEQGTEKDVPPAPPAKTNEAETSPRTQPEEQVVMESTADAPQPYETVQHGEITPEAAEQVAEGNGDSTHIAANLTETAPTTPPGDVAGRPDDLMRIDGIGRKVSAALQAAGIDSFQKLANTSNERLQEILQAANVRVVSNFSTWPQQASYAAQGDWEGFNRFNRERKSRGED